MRNRPVALVVAAVLGLAVVFAVFRGYALDPNQIIARTGSGDHALSIEWAVTPAERERGLMERKSMPENHGMLFDFQTDQPVYFWMKDTPMALDMVFITGEGSVYRIERKTTPFSLTAIPSGAPVRYVLEVVAGEADRIGLKPGDSVSIPKR